MSLSILLILGLTFGQIYGYPGAPAAESENVTIPLFVKDVDGTTFKPYKAFDYKNWIPDPSLYAEGLPMVQKQVTVDGKQLTYQDFNVSALTLQQFKEHFLRTADFVDANGKLVFSDEEAQAYQESLIAAADDIEASIRIPIRFSKRDFPDGCFYDRSLQCNSACINHVSRGVLQTVNNDVYGAWHYVSDPQCGTGSITKTKSVTHVSGLAISGSGQIPGFGKGWTKAISNFFSTFGISVGHVPESVTTGISFSGNCPSWSVCFLWERPHFAVQKGIIITENLDVNTNRACSNPTVTPFEAHIMHQESDAGGATSHGMCYSMAAHGCPRPVRPTNTLPRCPGNY